MAPHPLRRGAVARSFALALLACQLQLSPALRSLASARSEERLHRRSGRTLQQLDREAITLGGGRDVWLLDGVPAALLTSGTAPPAAKTPAARPEEASLLQRSSSHRRQLPFSSESEEYDDHQGFGNLLQAKEEAPDDLPLYEVVGKLIPVLQGALEAAGASDEDILAFNQELDPEKLTAGGPGALVKALGRALKTIDPAKLKAAAPEMAMTLGGMLKVLGPEKLKGAVPAIFGILQGIGPEKMQAAAGKVGNAVGGVLKAASKTDDVDKQVEVLEAFIKLSGWVTETAKAAALQLNSSITDSSSPMDAALGLQALFASGASATEFYKESVGALQKTLLDASGGLPAYLPRYAWMEQWKEMLKGMQHFYANGTQKVGESLDVAPDLLGAELCPFLGVFLPTLHNVSLGYVASLAQVVTVAHQNQTLVETEPVKTGVRMITSAMSAVKVEGIFLEEDGLTEQVCRSAVFAANKKFGCKLQLPWAAPVAIDDQPLSKEDEAKLEQAAKEIEKMKKQGPFMASHHMKLVWTVLIVCGVMMVAACFMCLQLPLELLAAPFVIPLYVVKGVLDLAFGILGLAIKIVAAPVVAVAKCCCGWKSKEEAMGEVKESQSSGIPTDVLNKMPIQERIMQKGSEVMKAATEGAPQGLAQAAPSLPAPPPGAEDAPEGAAAPGQQRSWEHPMYAKMGLNPVAALKKQYERKK